MLFIYTQSTKLRKLKPEGKNFLLREIILRKYGIKIKNHPFRVVK